MRAGRAGAAGARPASTSSRPPALPEVVVHGLVQRLHDRRPPAGRDPARARRRVRHRHHGDPAGPARSAPGSPSPPGRPRSSSVCRELGAEILVNYREQDFVEEVRGGDRRRRRRRHPRQHGREVPRPQRRCARHQRSPRRHRHAGRHQGRARPRRCCCASAAPSSRPRCAPGPADEKAAIVRGGARARLAAGRGRRVRPVIHSPLPARARRPRRTARSRPATTSARSCSPPDRLPRESLPRRAGMDAASATLPR